MRTIKNRHTITVRVLLNHNVADGTPDVELDGGHGSHGEVLPLTKIHHRVVVPVPLPI